jgi:sugar phosphate isomerase/epimerase
MSDRDRLLYHLEETARSIGGAIGRKLDEVYGPKQVGFCLITFHFWEGGFSTYVSNAQPEDMIAALRELADKRETQLKETGR